VLGDERVVELDTENQKHAHWSLNFANLPDLCHIFNQGCQGGLLDDIWRESSAPMSTSNLLLKLLDGLRVGEGLQMTRGAGNDLSTLRAVDDGTEVEVRLAGKGLGLGCSANNAGRSAFY
jgi:hypothetical protein